mmetsp:Transcript_25426/g.83637  ORF Transcript_25426/g.83637 Transcript_25426/m.83637 type:complete len:255 (+) Transcript_25426:16-780(+)
MADVSLSFGGGPGDSVVPGVQPQHGGERLQFMSFASTTAGATGGGGPAYPPPPPAGPGPSFGAPLAPVGVGGFGGGFASSGFDDEPPLLEELGIDLPHIFRKTRSVLHPWKTSPDLMDDSDLAGPLLFALAMGSAHLLMGKVHFGCILGWSVVLMGTMYWLVNLLSGHTGGLELYRCGSLLGYCLLPMVCFATLAVILPHRSTFTLVLAVLTTLWCTRSSSKLLTQLLHLDDQRYLVAFPCALVYSTYALLTVY